MTTVLKNFVTIKKTRDDVLSPTEYRTIVEMIKGISKKYGYTNLIKDYEKFVNHIEDLNDPHHDSEINFIDEIIQKTHAIYVNMTGSPYNLDDFTTNIACNIEFIELLRRIFLNRYLYDQVKLPNGSVPTSATVSLSKEWGINSFPNTPVTLTFGSGISSEIDFIRLGWNANTSPIAVIFNAVNLYKADVSLFPVFEVFSEMEAISQSDIFTPITVPLDLVSNDLTVKLHVVGSTTSVVSLFSLNNGFDNFDISLNLNQHVLVKLNNNILIQTTNPISDGKIVFSMNRTGVVYLQTIQGGIDITQSSIFSFTNDNPVSIGVIGINYENVALPGFGLRSLSIHLGHI